MYCWIFPEASLKIDYRLVENNCIQVHQIKKMTLAIFCMSHVNANHDQQHKLPSTRRTHYTFLASVHGNTCAGLIQFREVKYNNPRKMYAKYEYSNQASLLVSSALDTLKCMSRHAKTREVVRGWRLQITVSAFSSLFRVTEKTCTRSFGFIQIKNTSFCTSPIPLIVETHSLHFCCLETHMAIFYELHSLTRLPCHLNGHWKLNVLLQISTTLSIASHLASSSDKKAEIMFKHNRISM